MNQQTNLKILKRDNFTCQKCGFQDLTAEELEVHPINPRVFEGSEELPNLVCLCSICHKHAPDDEKSFLRYLNQKLDSKILDTFRMSNNSISRKTKHGMAKAFHNGAHLTKAPKGYKIVNKQLVPDEQELGNIRKLFEEFLTTNISLTQLAKKYKMTPMGISKLLKNTTYLGKVKFAGIETQGNHEPILEQDLFDKVQEKLGG